MEKSKIEFRGRRILCTVSEIEDLLAITYYRNNTFKVHSSTGGYWKIEDDKLYMKHQHERFFSCENDNEDFARDFQAIKKALLDIEFEKSVLR